MAWNEEAFARAHARWLEPPEDRGICDECGCKWKGEPCCEPELPPCADCNNTGVWPIEYEDDDGTCWNCERGEERRKALRFAGHNARVAARKAE